MKLAEYLRAQGISYAEFAKTIRVTGKDTVRRYVEDGRVPSEKIMVRIAEATNFKVTANDFFGMPV